MSKYNNKRVVGYQQVFNNGLYIKTVEKKLVLNVINTRLDRFLQKEQK